MSLMHAEVARTRILVCDDDAAIRELITTRLELAGYQTFRARDGVECLAELANVKPAGLILDVNMPRLDGFDVLRIMAENPEIPPIPTMVLTARNRGEDVRKAVSLGARDFLTKPFEDRLLLQRVARLVRRRSAEAPSAAAATKGGDVWL
jgi:CheY-like chemotaxis protein